MLVEPGLEDPDGFLGQVAASLPNAGRGHDARSLALSDCLLLLLAAVGRPGRWRYVLESPSVRPSVCARGVCSLLLLLLLLVGLVATASGESGLLDAAIGKPRPMRLVL